MTSPHFNLKKNVWFAVAEFAVNIGLVFASYRLVIMQGGVPAVGLWSTLFAWTSLIRIGDLGMVNATMRFVALRDASTERNAVRDYIETGIVANAGLFAILAVAGYFLIDAFVGHIVVPEYVADAHAILPAMILGFFLLNMSSVIMGSMQGLHLGFVRSQLAVFGNLVQLVSVFVLVPRLGLIGLAWGQIIQHSVSIIIAWIIVRRAAGVEHLLPLGFKASSFREMLGFSLTSQLANVSNGLFEPVSKILVSQFGGLHVQGLYELAYKTVWLSRNAVIAGVTATMPAMTALFRQDPVKVVPVYSRSLRLTLLAVGSLMGLVTLGSPIISIIWIGDLMWDYSIIVAIMAIGVFFNAAGAPAYNLATVTGNMSNNILVSVSVLVTLIIGGLAAAWLLPIHALIGMVAFAMGMGGLWIKARNERLLPTASSGE
jgi:O-antigen/teichoic acid export membrane protein